MTNLAIDYTKLDIDERLALVEEIWDSIAEDTGNSFEITPELKAELDRRYENYLANPSSALSWDEIKDEFENKYK